MTAHRLTIKGQVTIPKEIRDYLGLTEGGSSVDFSIGPDGTVILKKAGASRPAQRTTSRRPTHSVTTRANIPAAGVLSLLSGGF